MIQCCTLQLHQAYKRAEAHERVYKVSETCRGIRCTVRRLPLRAQPLDIVLPRCRGASDMSTLLLSSKGMQSALGLEAVSGNYAL